MAPVLILIGFLTLRVERNKGLVNLVGIGLTCGKGFEYLSIVAYGDIYKPKDGKKEKIFDVLENTQRAHSPTQRVGLSERNTINGTMCSHVPNKGEPFDLGALDRQMIRYNAHYFNVAHGKGKDKLSILATSDIPTI